MELQSRASKLPRSSGMIHPERLTLIATGCLVLFAAAALGAYGTHGVQGVVDAARWGAYEVAVDYQFYHGLGIVAAGILADRFPESRSIARSGWILLIGIAVFSGSIYATTFGAPDAIGALAPLGGLAMMAGWLLLALGVWRAGRSRVRE